MLDYVQPLAGMVFIASIFCFILILLLVILVLIQSCDLKSFEHSSGTTFCGYSYP